MEDATFNRIILDYTRDLDLFNPYLPVGDLLVVILNQPEINAPVHKLVVVIFVSPSLSLEGRKLPIDLWVSVCGFYNFPPKFSVHYRYTARLPRCLFHIWKMQTH